MFWSKLSKTNKLITFVVGCLSLFIMAYTFPDSPSASYQWAKSKVLNMSPFHEANIRAIAYDKQGKRFYSNGHTDPEEARKEALGKCKLKTKKHGTCKTVVLKAGECFVFTHRSDLGLKSNRWSYFAAKGGNVVKTKHKALDACERSRFFSTENVSCKVVKKICNK